MADRQPVVIPADFDALRQPVVQAPGSDPIFAPAGPQVQIVVQPVTGPRGPQGEPGDPGGPPGPSGQPRFTGEGPPTVIIGSSPGDEYLDNTTGIIYQLV